MKISSTGKRPADGIRPRIIPGLPSPSFLPKEESKNTSCPRHGYDSWKTPLVIGFGEKAPAFGDPFPMAARAFQPRWLMNKTDMSHKNKNMTTQNLFMKVFPYLCP
jgi:hypothetical protein